MQGVGVHPGVRLQGARICVRVVVLLCIRLPGSARVCCGGREGGAVVGACACACKCRLRTQSGGAGSPLQLGEEPASGEGKVCAGVTDATVEGMACAS